MATSATITILCWTLGFLALTSQPHPLPADFVQGAHERAEAVVDWSPKNKRGKRVPYFLGIQWICDPGPADQGLTVSEHLAEGGDDVCYAGLELNFDDAGGLVTGP